jgi:hypothetical protein
MANETTQALVKVGESEFPIIDQPEAKEIMLGAFDQMGLSHHQLNRIRVPAGGMTAWEVETLKGTTVEPYLDVVILAVKGNQKTWWATPIEEAGGGAPPSCVSKDGRTGFGVNTLEGDATPSEHSCAECAWNQYGSSRGGGNGKDCSDHALLFFFPKGSRIPSLLMVPATSLKPLQKYVLQLIDSGKRQEGCVTRLGLTKASSQGGITYSQLSLSWVADLEDKATATMTSVAKEFTSRISEFNAFNDKE